MAHPDSLGPVTIGAREIYDLGMETKQSVDKLDGKLDGAIGDLTELKADHESRIRTLEQARWPLPSLAVLVSLASLILAVIAFTHR